MNDQPLIKKFPMVKRLHVVVALMTLTVLMASGLIGAGGYALALRGKVNRALAEPLKQKTADGSAGDQSATKPQDRAGGDKATSATATADKATSAPGDKPTTATAQTAEAGQPGKQQGPQHRGKRGKQNKGPERVVAANVQPIAGQPGQPGQPQPPHPGPPMGMGQPPQGGGPNGQPGGPPGSLPDALKKLLKEKSLFGRAQQNFALQGILGETAMVNNEWVKLGESKNGFTLKEIQNSKVVLDVDGERLEIDLWQSMPTNQPPPMGGGSPGNDPGRKGEKHKISNKELKEQFDVDNLGKIPKEARQKLREAIKNGQVSPEMIEQLKKQYQ